MIYFKKNDKEIKKYEVNFDCKKIEEIKEEIIEECSFIEHKEYRHDYKPYDYTYIRNYKDPVVVGACEYDTETRIEYAFNYDLLIPPRLVKLIDRLLSGSESALWDIKNYNTSTIDELAKQIEEKNEELDRIPKENTKEKIEKLQEIDVLLSKKKLNKNCQPIEPYYNRLLALIKEELVDTIPLQDVKRVETFFNLDLTKKVYLEEKPKIKVK